MTAEPQPTPTETRHPVELSASEISLVRTALRLLESTLGREEADELAAVQAVLRRLPEADGETR